MFFNNGLYARKIGEDLIIDMKCTLHSDQKYMFYIVKDKKNKFMELQLSNKIHFPLGNHIRDSDNFK